jgi:sugar-specific transcriptional regulator TrmB
MDRDYLLKALTMMGLTNREAEVFLVIAEKGETSVKDILELVDVHQPQLYNILSSLIRREFIKVSSSRPIRELGTREEYLKPLLKLKKLSINP